MTKKEKEHVKDFIDQICISEGIDSDSWIKLFDKWYDDFHSEELNEKNDVIQEIARFVHDNIRPGRQKNGISYVNPSASAKIVTRLNQYSLAELKKAIIKFSHNKWRMEHNSNKSLDWYFRSDQQIETFLHLEEDMMPEAKGYVIGNKTYNLQEVEEAERKGEIIYDHGRKQFIPAE